MKTTTATILSYVSFAHKSGSYATVSEDKFKKDIQTLIENGYSSISLSDLTVRSEKEKVFCILLHGGYSNHYKVAFPILKEMNVHADAFIPTELVGRTHYSGIDSFVPHFSWVKLMKCIEAVWWISMACGILLILKRTCFQRCAQKPK